jgi:hypothetical protein
MSSKTRSINLGYVVVRSAEDWPYAGEIARLALVKEETRGHRPRAYDSAITALTRHHNLLILREHIADANLKEGTA